jgi:hypothetical protein
MEETIKFEMTKEEAMELMDSYLEKLKQIQERMAQRQVVIEQYRAETRAVIERLNRKAA